MTFSQVLQYVCLALLSHLGYEAIVSVLGGLFHVFQEIWVVINGDNL